MDIFSMLKALHEEKAAIEDAIRALNRLNSAERRARRGRPPKWLQGQASTEEDAAGAVDKDSTAGSATSKAKPGRPKRRNAPPPVEDYSDQESAA